MLRNESSNDMVVACENQAIALLRLTSGMVNEKEIRITGSHIEIPYRFHAQDPLPSILALIQKHLPNRAPKLLPLFDCEASESGLLRLKLDAVTEEACFLLETVLKRANHEQRLAWENEQYEKDVEADRAHQRYVKTAPLQTPLIAEGFRIQNIAEQDGYFYLSFTSMETGKDRSPYTVMESIASYIRLNTLEGVHTGDLSPQEVEAALTAVMDGAASAEGKLALRAAALLNPEYRRVFEHANSCYGARWQEEQRAANEEHKARVAANPRRGVFPVPLSHEDLVPFGIPFQQGYYSWEGITEIYYSFDAGTQNRAHILTRLINGIMAPYKESVEQELMRRYIDEYNLLDESGYYHEEVVLDTNGDPVFPQPHLPAFAHHNPRLQGLAVASVHQVMVGAICPYNGEIIRNQLAIGDNGADLAMIRHYVENPETGILPEFFPYFPTSLEKVALGGEERECLVYRAQSKADARKIAGYVNQLVLGTRQGLELDLDLAYHPPHSNWVCFDPHTPYDLGQLGALFLRSPRLRQMVTPSYPYRD